MSVSEECVGCGAEISFSHHFCSRCDGSDAQAAALATAQARIEELEAALEAIEKVVEMALECDESMEWLAEKVEAVLGKAKP